MEKYLFIDFCQIFENKKSKIRHLGLYRNFERFSCWPLKLRESKFQLKSSLREGCSCGTNFAYGNGE
jgi:hypothetical protein